MLTHHLTYYSDLPVAQADLTKKADIAPFYLYQDKDRPWLCPVQAFAIWWSIASQGGGQNGGFVFRKWIGKDGFSVWPDDVMVCF